MLKAFVFLLAFVSTSSAMARTCADLFTAREKQKLAFKSTLQKYQGDVDRAFAKAGVDPAVVKKQFGYTVIARSHRTGKGAADLARLAAIVDVELRALDYTESMIREAMLMLEIGPDIVRSHQLVAKARQSEAADGLFDRLVSRETRVEDIAAMIVRENNSGPYENTFTTTPSRAVVAQVGVQRVFLADEVLATAAFMTVHSRRNGAPGISDHIAAHWFREALETAAVDANLLTTKILFATLDKMFKRGGMPNFTNQSFADLKAEALRATPLFRKAPISYRDQKAEVEMIARHFVAGSLPLLMTETGSKVVRFKFVFRNVDFPIVVELQLVEAAGIPKFQLKTEHHRFALPSDLNEVGFARALENAAAREKFQSER